MKTIKEEQQIVAEWNWNNYFDLPVVDLGVEISLFHS